MRWSKSHIYTLKDAPNDAEIPSHKLMARAGLIRKVAPGIYTYGNLALRALRKLETIIRQELDSRGCQEVLMPMVQPPNSGKRPIVGKRWATVSSSSRTEMAKTFAWVRLTKK
jgi:prolyl-tRNA synthetase